MKNKKKNTVIAVTAVGLAVITASVLLMMGNSKKKEPEVKSKITDIPPESSQSIVIDELDEKENTDVRLKDNGKGISPDESKADEILKKAREKKKKSVNTPAVPKKADKKTAVSSKSSTSSKNSTSKKSSTEKETKSAQKKISKKYVKDADPNTGISWDGKSKIIYRTVSGDTTVKTYGGYYEIRPNKWVLLEYPTKKSEYDGKCPYCGKVSGDGTNGTCIRYSLLDEDMTCPNCNETIPAKSCHTCKGR